MKASKEMRQWVNESRSWRGKKNGVIPWLWDAPDMEIKHDKSKKNYSRKNERQRRC